MNKINQLAKIHHSGKPYIIYKSQNGFDLYTDFSKEAITDGFQKGEEFADSFYKTYIKKNVEEDI